MCDVCQYFYRAQSGQVVWDDAAASLGQWRGRPSKDLLQQQLDAATPTHLTSQLTDHPLQPRLQGSVDRPWTSPRTVDESLSDWLREGYNVSGRRPGPPSDWSAAYESCPDFMAPWAQRGDESAFQRTFPDFVADADNALYRQSPWGAEAAPDAEEDSHSGSYRLCVPTAKRREVLEEVHDSKTAGHMGSRRTLARLRSSGLHWPGMARDVEEFVATCEVCQRTKPAVAPQGITSPLEVPAGRWKVVSLDIVTGLPKSEGSDHDCVVTFTDRFSSRPASYRAARRVAPKRPT